MTDSLQDGENESSTSKNATSCREVLRRMIERRPPCHRTTGLCGCSSVLRDEVDRHFAELSRCLTGDLASCYGSGLTDYAHQIVWFLGAVDMNTTASAYDANVLLDVGILQLLRKICSLETKNADSREARRHFSNAHVSASHDHSVVGWDHSEVRHGLLCGLLSKQDVAKYLQEASCTFTSTSRSYRHISWIRSNLKRVGRGRRSTIHRRIS